MPEQELPSKNVGDKQTAPNATDKPAEESAQARVEMPTTSAPVQPDRQKAPYHREITCKAEKNWWDKAKPWVEMAGVLLLGAYTLFTVLTFWQIKKQTPEIVKSARAADDAAKLNRQVAEATQATILTFFPEGDSEWSDDGKTVVVHPTGSIRYTNDGKLAVFNVNAAFTLETRLTSGNKLLESQSIKIHRDQVNAGSQGAEPFTIGNWKTMEPLFFRWKATAIIRGAYSYDNTFNRHISEENACFQIVPNYHPSQTPMIQGASWVECKQVPDSLRNYERAIREAAKNKSSPK